MKKQIRLSKSLFMMMAMLALSFFMIKIQAQELKVKKTCECTVNGNISSTVRFSSSSLYPNKKYKATVTVENVGTCTWADREVELRVKIIRCPSGSGCERDELIPKKWTMNDRDIIPGYNETFVYDFEGPEYTGKFVLQYQLYFDNKPFGDPILTTIEIKPGKG